MPHTRHVVRGWIAATATIAVGATCLCASATAAAQQPSCGDVVTHSIKLVADLNCEFLPDALTVGKDGITINLNGHTIDEATGGAGIDSEGHSHVTIRNGTVSGSGGGIDMEGGGNNLLYKLTVNTPGPGCSAQAISIGGGPGDRIVDTVANSPLPAITVSSDGATLDGDTATNDCDGAAIVLSSNSAVVRASKTAGFLGGILVEGSSNRITRNDVQSETLSSIDVGSGNRNVITGNTAMGSDGIQIESGATNTSVIANTANGNPGDGFLIQSASTVLIGNVANNNGGYGIEAVPGVLAIGNRASGNGNPAQCLNVTCTS